MTKIRISIGLNPFEDWADEELALYDKTASRECYIDLCCSAINILNPDIEIEEILSYSSQPYVISQYDILDHEKIDWQKDADKEDINIPEIPAYEELCQNISDICLQIYSDPDSWLLMRI